MAHQDNGPRRDDGHEDIRRHDDDAAPGHDQRGGSTYGYGQPARRGGTSHGSGRANEGGGNLHDPRTPDLARPGASGGSITGGTSSTAGGPPDEGSNPPAAPDEGSNPPAPDK